MNYKIFIEKLKEIPLSYDEYKSLDYDDDFIKEIYAGFNLTKIDNRSIGESMIIEFICNYHLKDFEVGVIRFNSAEDIVVNDGYLFVGQFDADSLAIDKESREVVVLDYSDYTNVLLKCAKSEGDFLGAILEAAKYLELNAVEADGIKLVDQQVEECTKVAGGNLYRNFYGVLLGL